MYTLTSGCIDGYFAAVAAVPDECVVDAGLYLAITVAAQMAIPMVPNRRMKRKRRPAILHM